MQSLACNHRHAEEQRELEQQPLQLNRLLQVLTPNLDHSRVTHQLRKLENLPLALPYLRDVQKENLTAVNDAVN